MQLAAAADFETVCLLRFPDTQRNVFAELALQSIFQIPRRDVLPFRSGERRVVDHPGHRYRRLVDGDRLQLLWGEGIRECLSDFDVSESRDRDDLAGGRVG